MGKFVPCLILYKYIFFVKNFDQDKASFWSNQIMFSLEIHSKSKFPYSFLRLAGPRAHAQPTRTVPFPYFRAPWHRPTPAAAGWPQVPPSARHRLPGPPSSTPSSSAWCDRAPSSFLCVAPPTPDPSPFPFFSRSKAVDALYLSLSFHDHARHRGSPAPFSPSLQGPCTGLERWSAAYLAKFAPKRRHHFPPRWAPHLGFSSTFGSGLTLVYPPSHRTSPEPPPATTVEHPQATPPPPPLGWALAPTILPGASAPRRQFPTAKPHRASPV
jgi:hypothetical protein